MIRGHLKACVLSALEEEGRTGYSLIKYINEKTGWKPSYGSIYPLLEQLNKQKLVVCKEKDHKKTYTITTKGKEEFKNISCKKEELMEQIQEAMKICQTLYNFKLGKYQKKAMEMMQSGEIDITSFPSEIMKMKEIMSKLTVEGKIKTHKEE
ncbi:MAG: PadR family transcriptional regulator, partial [Nanoarchaeota archaeon]|nr:PadR family transcriptional regulator [Nanoarchaeota archaeon]